MNPTSKALLSFVKMILWTAVGAAIVYAGDNLTSAQLPEWLVPIVGAALKALATLVATKKGA
jgi:hypothetical protein